MTPKEKAKELLDDFELLEHPTYDGWGGKENFSLELAKICALLAVELAFQAIEDCSILAGHPIQYYQEVKEEIIAY